MNHHHFGVTYYSTYFSLAFVTASITLKNELLTATLINSQVILNA